MVPTDCRYTKEHEWVRIDSDLAVVGLTDFAQAALGDITFVELPAVGREVGAMDEIATIESVKAASDVYAPLAGTIADVNSDVEDDPAMINQEPHGAGWLCKLSGFDASGLDALMTAEQYEAFLAESGE